MHDLSLAALPALAALAALAGCGDSIVDEDYRGQPIAQFEYEVTDYDGRYQLDVAALRFTTLWRAPDGQLVADPATTASLSAYPAAHTLNFFQPPPAAALWAEGRFGVGVPAVFQEVDGRPGMGPDDLLLGVSSAALVYATEALSAEASPTTLPLRKGFHRTHLPMPCIGPADPPDADNCGVPLGQRCGTNADCGAGGTCMLLLPGPWPPICALHHRSACQPASGALAYTAPGLYFWVPRCDDTADCPADLRCDEAQSACVPESDTQVLVGLTTPEVPELCATGRIGPPTGRPQGPPNGPPRGRPSME